MREPTGIGSYEICKVCWWEDDGVQWRWTDERAERSDARIVATDTPDRSASSGRDMPAVRRTNSSVVSDLFDSADAAMDKAWRRGVLRNPRKALQPAPVDQIGGWA